MRLECVMWLCKFSQSIVVLWMLSDILINDVSSIEGVPPSSTKIIGGQLVRNQSDFGFMVSVRVHNRHICGGSIVDYRHVLTAAHCCFDPANKPYPPQIVSIAAGSLNIGRSNNDSVVKAVQGMLPHKKYDWDTITNDIAIIKIMGRFDFWNRNIRAIPLANFVPDRAICTTCGWGITQYNTSRVSNSLLYVDLPIVSRSICSNYYSQITDKMICAGGNGRDSCQGDSGGPLICAGVLTGLVSWGSECGSYPGVYTAVAKYESWIRKHIGSSSPSWITPAHLLLILQVLFAYYLV